MAILVLGEESALAAGAKFRLAFEFACFIVDLIVQVSLEVFSFWHLLLLLFCCKPIALRNVRQLNSQQLVLVLVDPEGYV